MISWINMRKKGEQLPHDDKLFTRERIASDLRKKYKKAVDSGSGGGRTLVTFYDLCNEIWDGCPTTTNLEHGLDTADFQLVSCH